MKKGLLTLVFAACACISCAATVGYHGAGVAIAPPLPATVVMVEPYYAHGGYHYYHHDDKWYYSRSKGGHWADLPRDRYPKEVRYKGNGEGGRWGDGRSRGREREWEHRDRGYERH